MMTLTRQDKIWLSELAALLLRGLSEVIVGEYKTAISIERTKDILNFGRSDKTLYGEKRDGF